MELRHYMRMLMRGWWIIALAALSALILALAKAYVTVPQYRTSARLMVSPDFAQIETGQQIYSTTALQNRTIVTTIAEVLNSGSKFKEVGERLNLPPNEIFHYKQSAVPIPEANVLQLYVDGPDPEIVTLLANGMAQQTIDEIDQTIPVYTLSVLDAALPPDSAESPKPMRDASLALILGGVFGAVLAIVQEQLRQPLQALRRRNTTDPVSTAYTRRHFDQQAKEILGRAETASLAIVYLDGLQDSLENLSAPVIQRVLRQVKTILRNELRGNDLIGRWDMTSFAVLLPDTPESAASRTLERILATLSQPIETGIENDTLKLTPYSGAATLRTGMTYLQLSEEAESALASSYRNGEKKVLFSVAGPQSA